MREYRYKNAVCYGSDIYRIDSIYKRLETFDTLPEARKHAKQYSDAHVIRLYFCDDGQLATYKEF